MICYDNRTFPRDKTFSISYINKFYYRNEIIFNALFVAAVLGFLGQKGAKMGLKWSFSSFMKNWHSEFFWNLHEVTLAHKLKIGNFLEKILF